MHARRIDEVRYGLMHESAEFESDAVDLGAQRSLLVRRRWRGEGVVGGLSARRRKPRIQLHHRRYKVATWAYISIGRVYRGEHFIDHKVTAGDQRLTTCDQRKPASAHLSSDRAMTHQSMQFIRRKVTVLKSAMMQDSS